MPTPPRTIPSRPVRTGIVIAAAALATASLASAAPATARERAAAPEGVIVVFVSEGTQVSWAGTRLREYPASPECQSLPPGAHVAANHSNGKLFFYADPYCVFPVPPPFNFIPPDHGAHVSPTGSFRIG